MHLRREIHVEGRAAEWRARRRLRPTRPRASRPTAGSASGSPPAASRRSRGRWRACRPRSPARRSRSARQSPGPAAHHCRHSDKTAISTVFIQGATSFASWRNGFGLSSCAMTHYLTFSMIEALYSTGSWPTTASCRRSQAGSMLRRSIPEGHTARGDQGHLMPRERAAPQSEVIRVMFLEDSPCCGAPAPSRKMPPSEGS